MYNPVSVLENETQKVLRDFEIQTDHLISARRPNLVKVNKKENQLNSDPYHSDRPQRKIFEKNEKEKY